jgi:hypothetical protein
MSTQTKFPNAIGTGTLERPLYSPGLLLEDTDLTSAVDYTQQLTKMLFSSLFGCGVICGLKVKAELSCQDSQMDITVEKGLGLDCFGNPIEVPKKQTLSFNRGCDPFPESIWVTACYVDRECAPRELSCGCESTQDKAFTRHRAGFEIKLSDKMPEDTCSCEEPQKGSSRSTSRCCDEPDEAVTTGVEPVKDNRDCFSDHMEGNCACGCGCHCIVIGKITLKDGKLDNDGSDRSIVRDIRPVLVQHYRQPPRTPRAPAPAGAAGTSGNPAMNPS